MASPQDTSSSEASVSATPSTVGGIAMASTSSDASTNPALASPLSSSVSQYISSTSTSASGVNSGTTTSNAEPTSLSSSSTAPTSSTTAVPAHNSSTNLKPSTGHSQGSNISAGEVTGISIGTFIFGVALAALALWCLRKRGKGAKRNRQDHSGDYPGIGAGAGAGAASEKSTAVTKTYPIDEALLDPADDSALKDTMSNLNNFIEQHVLSYYHEDPVAISPAEIARAISDCNIRVPSGGFPINDLASLLVAPASRLQKIHYFIAWVLTSNINLDANADACLLPHFIVSFYNAFPATERIAGSDEAFESAMTSWKHLSAFLLVPNRSYREEPKLDPATVQPALDQNLKLMLHVLDPFIHHGVRRHDGREKNLRGIILSGAELALRLFSQPTHWLFDWKLPAGGKRNGQVVFPALLEKVKGRAQLRRVSDAVVS